MFFLESILTHVYGRNKSKGMPRVPEECLHRVTVDGNCLFRALSYCLEGSEDGHVWMRKSIVNHVTQQWSFYKDFVVGDPSYGVNIASAQDYIAHMEKSGVYGGAVEVTAAARMFNARIEVLHERTGAVATVVGDGRKRKFSLLYSGNGDSGHYDVLKCLP